jgi:hypothetical protein
LGPCGGPDGEADAGPGGSVTGTGAAAIEVVFVAADAGGGTVAACATVGTVAACAETGGVAADPGTGVGIFVAIIADGAATFDAAAGIAGAAPGNCPPTSASRPVWGNPSAGSFTTS